MRSLTATEARRNWFTLLDDVASGEVVEIRRGSQRIILRCEPLDEDIVPPDYSAVLNVRDASSADEWGWNWTEHGLEPTGLE